jgi:uncharacterized membrane protein YkgB
MDTIIIALQVIVGISILNVWLVQNKKATRWRGGNATTLMEEFQVYGLPVWSCYAIGILKVVFALMLLAGIWVPELIQVAASGLALLLAGSVAMHFRVNDPIVKSLPAGIFLVLCLGIIVLS